MTNQKIPLQDKELEERIKKVMTELIEKQKHYEENGHVKKEDSSYIASGSHTGTRVYATCAKCGMMYYRALGPKEQECFNSSMRTPFTI
jgi:transketolase N-terminal domain/subunit